jgi:putative tryptophan/tyrosine transport system substrate-binding protein
MKRREFIAGLGSTAAWPVVARAQQRERVRRIGLLISLGNDQVQQSYNAAIRDGLAQRGWIEGRNLLIDVRLGGGDVDRLRASAMELVSLAPDVIVCNGAPATRAVQQQTRTIPIVFVGVADPVPNGFVKNIARPDGNITGAATSIPSISSKWLELLKEAAPNLKRVGVIYNAQLSSGIFLPPIDDAAHALSVLTIRIPFHDGTDIAHGIDAFAAEPEGGLIVLPPTGPIDRATIIQLAIRHRLPSIYGNQPFATDGGLMAYGTRALDQARRVGYFVDRILRGTKVSDLPVEFPAAFDLIVNMKTAKAIGLTIPESVLFRADEVIE